MILMHNEAGANNDNKNIIIMTLAPRTPPRIVRGASAILNRAKGSFTPGRGAAAGGSSSTTTQRGANNKSPVVNFAIDDTNNNEGGGSIDNDHGVVGGAIHSGNTLETYVLPPSLRMNVVDEYANGGMEVIKVSKVRSCHHWLSRFTYFLLS